MQHVELVQLEQVDHPPDLPTVKNLLATSSDKPRQANLGASRMRMPGNRLSPALPGGAVASSWISVVRPRDADRFHGAHHHLTAVDHQRVSFVGRAAAARGQAYRRGQRSKVVPGRQLDLDGWFIRYRAARSRR